MKVALSVLAACVLASCTQAPRSPATDTVQRGEGVIIVTLTNGNKVLMFDNGSSACFDKWGNVCDD